MRAKDSYYAHMQTAVRTEHTTELAYAIGSSDMKKVDLAAMAGISPSHLTRALRLERPLARRAIEVIVAELGLDLGSVYDGHRLREHTGTSSCEQEQQPPSAPTPVGAAAVAEGTARE